MKKQLLLIFSFFSLFNISCTSQQKKESDKDKSTINSKIYKIEKIELTEQTRGTNRKITFVPGSVTTSLNDNITTAELSAANWENIIKEATLIDLDKISSYESPTTGRFSDKALASTIIITSGGKEYTSAGFDAGIPPKELEALYQSLRGKNNIIQKAKPKFSR
ncbi:hypothetical protein [Chryseobacterium populi]|uniref:Uncharacterized protein n=1 Tax=Chryseobacterium populi TaxID=1144316 RepID=J2JJR1_9FLAO|nr:hypothetical protein [Chryseobacterium populi]EJL68120.1 hypothetical protein PMI13_03875 [Chryseobacterium populi]